MGPGRFASVKRVKLVDDTLDGFRNLELRLVEDGFEMCSWS